MELADRLLRARALRASVAILALSAASCHLASDPAPSSCPTGESLQFGKCLPDPAGEPVVTIRPAAGGTSCGAGADRPPQLSPTSLTVKVKGDFSFKNEDTVDHEIRGPDGRAWTVAAAGKLSGVVAISLAGSYAYTVSGCAGGTIVVE